MIGNFYIILTKLVNNWYIEGIRNTKKDGVHRAFILTLVFL